MKHEMMGGVTAARGYTAAGVHAGLKKTKKDLALLVSETPAVTAGVFTVNKAAAAPVVIDRAQLQKNPLQRAVLINSGSANACTGPKGMDNGYQCIQWAAGLLNIPDDQVLIASTGVIGLPLDMEKMSRGLEMAGKRLGIDGHLEAAQAIMTTDTFPKENAVGLRVEGRPVAIGGMAKGSGMIKPNMATMMGFITTDAAIPRYLLQDLLKKAVDRSFNRISVDNDTSTNDMVIVMANGCSGAPEIVPGSESCAEFHLALLQVCQTLARMIVRDGEGATKLIEVRVKGARTEAEALQAARAVADSMLVKTAFHGEDANWGRIIAAIGYSGIDFLPERTSLNIGGLDILRPDYQVAFREEDAKEVLRKSEIALCIDLHQGEAEERVWTSDLSKEYVAINAHYRS
jgi:glutamate N-acetyltransferase / amino-acid N-acetyltransferase